jgi:hypothetical protein
MKSEKIITHAEIIINPDMMQDSFFTFLNGKLENAPVVTYLEEV